ncbi:hypothetical protein B0H17DRAFT_1332763 [Mycena rosella]|uniref:Protein kinase domain-containing protein n=1 Tax=Mycena rosella TaxID=1033263 RepID=A0AAD7GE04_MYCRO|nr:hypothetical protein B0H17DRAFT_1332763 [Mycena rosella]
MASTFTLGKRARMADGSQGSATLEEHPREEPTSKRLRQATQEQMPPPATEPKMVIYDLKSGPRALADERSSFKYFMDFQVPITQRLGLRDEDYVLHMFDDTFDDLPLNDDIPTKEECQSVMARSHRVKWRQRLADEPEHRHVLVVVRKDFIEYLPPASEPRTVWMAAYDKDDIAPSQAAQHSTYTKLIDRHSDKLGVIATDRPDKLSPPLVDDIESGIPSPEDFVVAKNLREAMSELYGHENLRCTEFDRVLGDWFGRVSVVPFLRGREANSGHWVVSVNGEYLVALWEGNLEIGSGGVEPHWQAHRYFIESTGKEAEREPHRRFPMLMGAWYGADIDLSIAIWTNDRPIVQRVSGTTLSLDWHATDEPALLRAARFFYAYRQALNKLATNWWPSEPNDLPPSDVPDFMKYTSKETGGEHCITYKGRMRHKLIWHASSEEHPTLLVKFTRRYGVEAHLLCAQHRIAPRLFACEPIGGGWFAVVMEDVSRNYYQQNSVLEIRSLKEKLHEAVNILHHNGFVHGDLRPANILWKTDASGVTGDVLLVDFDWAGKEAETRYPGDLNPEITRHADALDGAPITKEHDYFMLDLFRVEGK